MLLVMLIFFVPSFFLAGLIDPIHLYIDRGCAALPRPLPATHYITIARGLFLKGVGWDILRQPALMLIAMGLPRPRRQHPDLQKEESRLVLC